MSAHAFPSNRFSVAPMAGWTTRFCRQLHRLLTEKALLYTEMISMHALLRGSLSESLPLSPTEGPVALQLGGDDPTTLGKCAALVDKLGYTEINLNVGCPSAKVKSGNFGAILFQDPEKVARCIRAMKENCSLAVSVKTRLGINHQDSWEAICRFIEVVYEQSGCDYFIFHARKAWLEGLNPKQNRAIPPLNPSFVHRIKLCFPQLTVIYNGGITDLDRAASEQVHVDGVMVGRAAYQQPDLLREVDQRFFQSATPPPTVEVLLDRASHCLKNAIDSGARAADVGRHLMGLFRNQPGAAIWRRHLSTALLQPKNQDAFWQAYEAYQNFLQNLKNRSNK